MSQLRETKKIQNPFKDFFDEKNQSHHRFCDCTDWNTWIWGPYLGARLWDSPKGKVLYRRMMDGTSTYTAQNSDPLSKDSLSLLFSLAKEQNQPLCLFPLSEAEKDRLLTLYPHALAETSPNWSDYLYHAFDLATFHGKKFNGQRNHLNRFRALYPEGTCAEICDQNRTDVLAFLDLFYSDFTVDEAIVSERQAITDLVKHAAFDGSEGLFGCAVFTKDGVVAMAIGEVVGDTLYIHAEKALRQVRGAYQAIVSGFASRFLEQGVKYINREEDDGNEGLRTSKLSYQPVSVLSKWRVILPSLETAKKT